jgi:hypothetical protein
MIDEIIGYNFPFRVFSFPSFHSRLFIPTPRLFTSPGVYAWGSEAALDIFPFSPLQGATVGVLTVRIA